MATKVTIKVEGNMRKFNAKLGRKVTYKFYPHGKFEIIKINPNGTLDLEQKGWRVLHVKVEDVMRNN